MNLRCCLLALFSAAICSSSATAAGLIIVDDPAQPGHLLPFPDPPTRPWLLPRPRPPGCVLEMTSHRIHARIRDQFAVTEIEQEFKNPTGMRLEGTFLFPVPKGAQLRKFTLEIDGNPVEAELLSADKARGVYEDIVRRQRDPALMEFVDRDLYKVRIFPIEPHGTKKVTFSYEQVLVSDSGLVQFVCPLSGEKFSPRPVQKMALSIDLESTRSVKSVYSPTHAVEIARKDDRHAIIGYESNEKSEVNDFELYFSREDEGVGMTLLTYRPDRDQDGYFMLLASPGLATGTDRVLPKDVVFVIDTSGSMIGGKLDQAKKALNFCVGNLNDADRFDVIRFATDVEPLFNGLDPADESHRRQARDFIERMKPLGGTAINDALKQALALPGMIASVPPRQSPDAARPASQAEPAPRPQMIVFLTDGLPTIGETRIDRIVANATRGQDGGPRIFCFGIGTDVNTHLLDRITGATRAASQYVLPGEDLERKLSSFFAKMKDPVLTRPALRLPGDAHVSRVYPSPLPDLFSGEQLVVVGRYASPAKGAVEIEGAAGNETRRFAEDVGFPEHAGGHDFIARVWATRRIGWLLDEIRLHGEHQELRDEVASLAREYGMVTPYTAWLIVEDEARRGVRPEQRTLRETSANRDALDFSRENYLNLGRTQTGPDATLSARAGGQQRNAQQGGATPGSFDSSALDERFAAKYGGAKAARPVPNPSPSPAASASRSGYARQVGTVPAGSPGLAPSQMTPSQVSEQSRTIAGKTFFQSGSGWMDAAIQQHPNARRVKILFGSPEYFALMTKGSNLGPWASIGVGVQFEFEGVIYEIMEERR
jgi:hypothetical protein